MLFCASVSGFCRQTGVFDALKEVKLAGFDGVDFPLSHYSRRRTDPLCNDNWWRSWTEAVADFTEELRLPVLQAHAPWEQTIAADLHYEAPSCLYARIFEACSLLQCQKLVFHPLQYPYRIASAETLSAIHAYNLRWFRELLPLAERYQITIELENTFDYYHLQMPGDPPIPYTTAQQLLALVRDLASPFVGICLDTGHANITGQNNAQMIADFADRLDCLHLNDNFGRKNGVNEDLHLFPGSGTIDWAQTAAALHKAGYTGVMNIEIIDTLAENTSEERVARLRSSREMLCRIMSDMTISC